jgi:hypothetical protein
LLEKIEGDSSKCRKILIGVFCSRAAIVFSECDVKAPVQGVFHAPMFPRGLSETADIRGKTAEKMASLDAALTLTVRMDSTMPMLCRPFHKRLSSNQSRSLNNR